MRRHAMNQGVTNKFEKPEDFSEILNTILVSDIHLGTSVSRPGDLLNVLKKYRYKRLVLLGDVFDDLNFDGMNEEHWELLAYIQALNATSDIEVVWIRGNHDKKKLIKIISRLLGLSVVREYVWELGGKKHFAIHGDKFDELLRESKIINGIAVFAYLFSQRMDTKYIRPSRWLKKWFAYSWKRSSEKVAAGAVAYGIKKHKPQYIYCGHTHQAMHKKIDGVDYYNTGCWADSPCGFVTISESGEIKLHEQE